MGALLPNLESRRMFKIVILLTSFVSSTSFALAKDVDEKTTAPFATCLAKEAREGAYNSMDGGKSAIRLMAACGTEWENYINACIATGVADGQCTLMSGILAQAALKMLGK